MLYEHIPNIAFFIGLLILILANIYFLANHDKPAWEGLGVILVYFWTLAYVGFPLVWIFFGILEKNDSRNDITKNNKKGDSIKWLPLFCANILFIIQWLIWRYLLKSLIFS